MLVHDETVTAISQIKQPLVEQRDFPFRRRSEHGSEQLHAIGHTLEFCTKPDGFGREIGVTEIIQILEQDRLFLRGSDLIRHALKCNGIAEPRGIRQVAVVNLRFGRGRLRRMLRSATGSPTTVSTTATRMLVPLATASATTAATKFLVAPATELAATTALLLWILPGILATGLIVAGWLRLGGSLSRGGRSRTVGYFSRSIIFNVSNGSRGGSRH